MVELYVKKILNNELTLEKVPKVWRSKVEKALEDTESEKVYE